MDRSDLFRGLPALVSLVATASLAISTVALSTGALPGCDGGAARDSLWRDYRRSRDGLSRQLWGSPMDERVLAETHHRFDCVWERLEAARRDPSQDVRCAIARDDAMVACTSAGETFAACEPRLEAICTFSDPFRAADRACSPPATAPVSPR